MSFTSGKINASDAKELQAFNQHLATKAYVDGFAPSNTDESLFKAFSGSVDAGKYAHVARWYTHIKSFSEQERSAWPKQGGSAAAPAEKATNGAGGDDFDLFGSDEEDDAEKERITQERLKAYAEKKAKKPGPIAKSNIIYDIKPWDDTIDTKDIETKVREIQCDGLVWGASKILPVAFGIKKLQICCVVEDEKVSSDWLEEQITDLEDLVQSVDVVAFNKV